MLIMLIKSALTNYLLINQSSGSSVSTVSVSVVVKCLIPTMDFWVSKLSELTELLNYDATFTFDVS